MTAIGVDFGYSSIRVGFFKPGTEESVSTVEIIENDLGSRSTPTIVAFDEGIRLIGVEALNHAALEPKDAIFDLKRLIGRHFDCLKRCLKNSDFDSLNDGGRLKISLPVSTEATGFFTTEQLLATIFVKIKEYAESEEISFEKAVISVPTYFSESQRQAVIAAAAIANFEVEDTINDTTAAALNYVWDKLDERYNGSCILFVFSFGASALDVALIAVKDYKIRVLSRNGSLSLGGVDFDNRLVSLCIGKFKEQYNIDVSEESRLMHKLRIQCEKAKITLQTKSDARVKIETANNEDLITIVKRDEFNDVCSDLFQQAMRCVESVFEDERIELIRENVNEVILVGGASRLKKIETLLIEFFYQKKLNRRLNVDEAIVNGAAIYAAILNDVNDEKVKMMSVDSDVGDENNGNLSMDVITDQEVELCVRFANEQIEGLSNDEIEEYKNELKSYKDNCLNEEEKVLLKNEMQSDFFKLRQYLQHVCGNLKDDDFNSIHNEIKAMNDHIDSVDTTVESLNDLRNQIEQKRKWIDDCLLNAENEKRTLIDQLKNYITKIFGLLSDAESLLDKSVVRQLDQQVSSICTWVNDDCKKSFQELNDSGSHLQNIEFDLTQLMAQEKSRREEAKEKFLRNLEIQSHTSLSLFSHLTDFEHLKKEFQSSMTEIEKRVANVNFPSPLMIEKGQQDMETIVSDLNNKCSRQESGRLEAKRTFSKLITEIKSLLNDPVKSKMITISENYLLEVEANSEWFNNHPFAPCEDLKNAIENLRAVKQEIDKSIGQESDRIAARNELQNEIQTFRTTYLTEKRMKRYYPNQLRRMMTEIKALSDYLEYNPSASQSDFEKKIEEVKQLKAYGQRKVDQVAESENETLFVGIDVGTTHCRVSVFSDGRFKKVKDGSVDFTQPSFVSVTDHVLIGDEAKKQHSFNRFNTIYNIKQLMGCKKDDKFYEDIEHLSYNVDDSLDKVKVRVNRKFVYTPEELTALLLTKLKCFVEHHFDKDVNSVTITVPVNFSNSQRQATFDAAIIAGFKNVRLVNDTIAASLKYLWEETMRVNNSDEKFNAKNVLVVSIGAVYTNVSVLRIAENKVDVKAHSGLAVGGVDFDKRLLRRILKISEEYRNFNTDEINDLLLDCEKCKIDLSLRTESTVAIAEIGGLFQRCVKVSRRKFEQISASLFDTIFKCVFDTLHKAGTQRGEIDEVIFIGGTTEIPKLKIFFEENFRMSQRNFFTNGSLASGAAIYSAVKSIANSMNVTINDLTLYGYSFESFYNDALIIEPDSRIPVKHKGCIHPYCDFQRCYEVKVYEQSDEYKTMLADIVLQANRMFRKNDTAYHVKIKLDSNGLISMSAIENGTKKCLELDVKCKLSKEEIQRSNTEIQKTRLRLMNEMCVVNAKQRLRIAVKFYAKQLTDVQDSIYPEVRKDLKALLSFASKVIDDDRDDQTYYANCLRNVECSFKNIIRTRSNSRFYVTNV